ncbi:MAG: hypothetical protein NVS3B11_15070 [Collimonas sp.]
MIKDAEALELMEKVTTVVVDKTGTLTEGAPKVQSVVAAEGFNDSTVLALAAALEKMSEHPLAQVILTYAAKKNISLEPIDGSGGGRSCGCAEPRVRLNFSMQPPAKRSP